MAGLDILGLYMIESAENLDEFYFSLGVSYYYSSILSANNQMLVIDYRDGVWTVSTFGNLLCRAQFMLGRQYSDYIEDFLRYFQSVTGFNGQTLATLSTGPESVCFANIKRTYEPTNRGCILTLINLASGTLARRTFVRIYGFGLSDWQSLSYRL